MANYQFIQIPKSSNIIVDIEAESLQAAIDRANKEIDTTFEWVIYLDGKSQGFLEHIKYSCSYSAEPSARKVKRNRDMTSSLYFDTPEAAIADRKTHEKEAIAKLNEIEFAFNELVAKFGATISYTMSGDTYGIEEDYMYISINVGGYQFVRKLED